MDKKSLQTADVIDEVEFIIAEAIRNNPDKYQTVECPLKHTFTEGLYCRQITMPAGIILTSEEHLTQHQYVILDGVVSVWTKEHGWQIFMAPYTGITKPGTRRILKIEATTVWATFHATDCKTVEEVHDKIIAKRINPLLGGRFENNVFIPLTDEIDNKIQNKIK